MTLRHGGAQGVPMNAVTYSSARLKRIQRARKRQEERWAARSGEVTVSRVEELAERHPGDPSKTADEE